MFRFTAATVMGLALALAGCGDTAGGVNIWDAVENGDAAAISTFAAAGGDLNVRNWGGSTPLWVALDTRNRDSYEALLRYGADPNAIMSGKRVVTHWAATEPDPWWLRLALEHGADPNLVNVGRGQPSEGTPLHFAIANGSFGAVSFVEHIELLVQHGADVDKPNRYNCYPLAKAAAQNDFGIILYLLDAGADYRLAEYSGVSFLEVIRQKIGYREKFLLEEDRKGLDTVRAWLEARGVDFDEH